MIRVTREGALLHVVLDRPEVRNALDDAMQDALIDVLEPAALDEEMRAVLITAEEPDFCAGGDLGISEGQRPRRVGHIQRRMPHRAHRVILAIWNIQLPVVAAVRGHASGVGCNLALACDYVVASTEARFSVPFVKRGFAPDTGAAFLLPRLVGVARANQLLLLGRTVGGRQAESWGLVSEAVEDELVDRRAQEVAAEFANSATVAIGLAKSLMHRSLALDLAGSLGEEGLTEELAVRSKDFKEGITAFRERRGPRFTGE